MTVRLISCEDLKWIDTGWRLYTHSSLSLSLSHPVDTYQLIPVFTSTSTFPSLFIFLFSSLLTPMQVWSMSVTTRYTHSPFSWPRGKLLVLLLMLFTEVSKQVFGAFLAASRSVDDELVVDNSALFVLQREVSVPPGSKPKHFTFVFHSGSRLFLVVSM